MSYTEEQINIIEEALQVSLDAIRKDYPMAFAVRWIGKINDSTIKVYLLNPSARSLVDLTTDLFETITCDVTFQDDGTITLVYDKI